MTPDVALTLKRPRPPKALISLVAMIDVLLILLVFFMVTSTYLDLDMIPAVASDDRPQTQTTPANDSPALPLMIRIGADGQPVVRGQPFTLPDLDRLLRQRLNDLPQTQVVILPTGVATMQALVSVMDVATQAGATQLRVIRLEPRP